jgi:TfoX/Sxy family transcriptional regulator of competence genes
MATEQKIVDYIIAQIAIQNISFKKMFGEYALYFDKKMFASVCDNKLFVKPTQGGRAFIGDSLIEASPYPGAKPNFFIDQKLDDTDWLKKLVNITVNELPEPKPKKKK